VSEPSVSPCGNFLVFVPWRESIANPNPLVIYDIRTDVYQLIELAHFGFFLTYAAWLDNRTVLISTFQLTALDTYPYVHFPHHTGTIHTIHALDIHDYTLVQLDIPLPPDIPDPLYWSIRSLRVVGDRVYMYIRQITPDAELGYLFPHSIATAEIHRLIAEGETREIPESNP